MLESFFWGSGTAFGELPPYFVARASAKAGKLNGELKEVKMLMTRKWKERNLSENLHVIMFYIVNYLGFFGILLAASIPNPLFDLAGLTCGYFLVPFYKFFIATFIGKAIFKASLQSCFVILIFSKDTLNLIFGFLKKYQPRLGTYLEKFLSKQEAAFLHKSVSTEEV
jgi:vacuole membrane protein 1